MNLNLKTIRYEHILKLTLCPVNVHPFRIMRKRAQSLTHSTVNSNGCDCVEQDSTLWHCTKLVLTPWLLHQRSLLDLAVEVVHSAPPTYKTLSVTLTPVKP